MGNDGGSIPDRRDLVKNKPKAEQADKNNQIIAQWFFCALSKRPLQEPIVSCALGKLYNKDAIIEYLLDKSAYGDGEKICSHIRSLKDVKTLKLTPNPSKTLVDTDKDITRPKAQFVCPLTLKEMSGSQPFVYLTTCGDVFSAAGLKAVASSSAEEQELCPQCGKKFDRVTDVRTINPGPEEAEKMMEAMIAARAVEKTSSKKRKAAAANGTEDASSTLEPKRAKHSPPSATATPPPLMSTALSSVARKVADSLAEEEKKRKGNMSAAVASLYQPKDAGKKSKETFMTMHTFTRYA